MKKLNLIMVLLVFGLISFSCAALQPKLIEQKEAPKLKSVYTYDGEFDPMVFFDWQDAASWPHGNHIHILKINPNVDSDVPAVEIVIVELDNNPYGYHRIMAYRYLKGESEIEYVFYLDGKGHYEQIEPTKVIDKSMEL